MMVAAGDRTGATGLNGTDLHERMMPSSLDGQMAAYRGRPVFFEPLGGNNGDRLLTAGSEAALRKWQVQRASQPEDAEVIVVNGSGGMRDIFPTVVATLKHYLVEFPQTPLIVLPTSYDFKLVDFPSLFSGRRAPVTLFARERYSRELLGKMLLSPSVRCDLDHDMAFRLRGTPFLERLRRHSAERHVLLVERRDAESVGAAPREPIRIPFKRAIPVQLKRPFKRIWVRARERVSARTSPFFEYAYGMATLEHPYLSGFPVYRADISDHSMYSFHQFCIRVRDAAAVVTNRLHVAILAALLSKRVYISTGVYHKVRGVFEHSLADDRRVRLLEAPPQS
jgi:exopolysaccharide biosynthesis predicted pyruvyltransferase EpsI